MISLSGCKNELYVLFIFLTAISIQFLYFPMPAFYCYSFLIMNLQLTWCLILDTEMRLEIFDTYFKTFPIFTPPIIPDLLPRTTFAHKAPGSLFNWTCFLELEQKFGTRCLLHLGIFQNMTLKEKLKEYFSMFCLQETPILTHKTSFKRSNFLKL